MNEKQTTHLNAYLVIADHVESINRINNHKQCTRIITADFQYIVKNVNVYSTIDDILPPKKIWIATIFNQENNNILNVYTQILFLSREFHNQYQESLRSQIITPLADVNLASTSKFFTLVFFTTGQDRNTRRNIFRQF